MCIDKHPFKSEEKYKDSQMDSSNKNKAEIEGSDGFFAMSTEALIMSLLEQIRALEEERDSARLLAVRMREKLQYLTGKSNESSNLGQTSVQEDGANTRLSKLLRDVSSNMVYDLQQVVKNEEQRVYNMRDLASCSMTNDSSSESAQFSFFQHQIKQYKEHYEKLLTAADNEKIVLRKIIKEKQDLVLDRDIKLKELEIKLQLNNNVSPK